MPKIQPLPVRRSMCATCPFRCDSPNAYLQPTLALSALSGTSRVCHSTGSANAIFRRPGIKRAALCRGARDLQLRYFAAMGFLDEPTDRAWSQKLATAGSIS